ncbi:LysR family transcriptional regulator [Massilia sp. KIM]|uniref:LysR family transcriptional regulator n=1 Tax=Massilia sp. KIM TaxID=1955422 RepID=UPI00098F000F|nr:LysR family transcriptional regulator [Massilia sp. KIM]OON62478.1 LysR family transcriptional regulator [Massilia sp. KIM]
MDIEDVRTFVDVADAGGISAAALRSGMSKSIVSRRLSKLETELGVQLLARTTRGAALTEAGATFREYAGRILVEFDTAKESLLPSGALRGRFRVAVPISFGPAQIGPLLAEMARSHPLLRIQASYSDRVVDLIGEGFDCAIRTGHLQNSNLKARRVGSIEGKLVASPSYIEAFGTPETPKEVAHHQCLMQGTEIWRFLDGDTVITAHPQGNFKADNPVALLTAAVAGLGLAYLADWVIADQLATGALVSVMESYPPQPSGIYVVRSPSQHSTRKIHVLTEMMLSRFGDKEQNN